MFSLVSRLVDIEQMDNLCFVDVRKFFETFSQPKIYPKMWLFMRVSGFVRCFVFVFESRTTSQMKVLLVWFSPSKSIEQMFKHSKQAIKQAKKSKKQKIGYHQIIIIIICVHLENLLSFCC